MTLNQNQFQGQLWDAGPVKETSFDEPEQPAPKNQTLNPNRFGFDEDQLPLFMSANTIQSYVHESHDRQDDDWMGSESMYDMWDRKLARSKRDPSTRDPNSESSSGFGVHQSIAENGFDMTKPVTVQHRGDYRFMGEGHHRVAASADLENTDGKTRWVPIKHEIYEGY